MLYAANLALITGHVSITMVNWTVETGRTGGTAWGGGAGAWITWHSAPAPADVAFSSTAAPHTIIHAEHVRAAAAGRTPPILIDLVLRDIDENVAQVPGAHLLLTLMTPQQVVRPIKRGGKVRSRRTQ